MATIVPDRGDDPRRKPDWKSAWPKGHQNYREYVSPEQEAENIRAKDPQRFHELRRNNGVPDYKPEQQTDWKSAWPKGHPNYREYVSPEQQARNSRS